MGRENKLTKLLFRKLKLVKGILIILINKFRIMVNAKLKINYLKYSNKYNSANQDLILHKFNRMVLR